MKCFRNINLKIEVETKIERIRILHNEREIIYVVSLT